MTNLRRLMVVVLAIVMIASSMATAFGAPLSDISGKKYEDAVNKLAAFNVAAGIDGQFKGEETLKRSEFATFIVNMMNLGKQDQVDTVFSDATAKDWFSGYVNAVAERGYMVGADGKFNPDKNVTYGEAITVLMKMLGYAPVVDKRGTWPGNYISRASTIKLTKGVAVSASAPVTRGNLAILLWKTLTTQPLIEGSTYDEDGNPNYIVSEDSEETLLFKNFEATFSEDEDYDKLLSVTATPMTSSIYTDKIMIGTKTYSVPKAYDPNAFIGQKVQFVADKDDKIAWMKSAEESENLITDTIKEIAGTNTSLTRIKFTALDKDYVADANTIVLYNGIRVTTGLDTLRPLIAETTYSVGVQDTANIFAVLDKETKKIKVAYITQDLPKSKLPDGLNIDGTNVIKPFFALVTTANADDIEFNNGYNIDKKAYLEKEEIKTSKNIIYKDGKVASLKDVKKNDLVRGINFTNMLVWYVYSPKIETVKFDSLEDINSLKDLVINAGDKKLKLGGYAVYSMASGDSKTLLTYELLDKFDAFLGVEGTKVFYGPSGKVCYFENAVAESAVRFGFVKEMEEENSVTKFTIYTQEGTTVTYNYDSEDLDEDNYFNRFVAYKLNKDNEIILINTLVTDSVGRLSTASDAKTVFGAMTSIDSDEMSFQLANDNNTPSARTFYMTSKTVFINWSNYVPSAALDAQDDDQDLETVSWDKVQEAIKNGDIQNTLYAGILNSSAVVVFLRETPENVSGSDNKYGIVTGTGLKDGKRTVKINYQGTVTEYFMTTGEEAYGLKGLPVQFKRVGSDKVDIVTVATAAYNTYTSGRLSFEKAYVGKVIDVDTDTRVYTYRTPTNWQGEVSTSGSANKGVHFDEDVHIYNLTDVNNITHTTDLATLVKGMFFVYVTDVSSQPIILILKVDNDNPDKSMIK